MKKLGVVLVIAIVALILVSCYTRPDYKIAVTTDIPQDDISLEVVDADFSYVSPKGAIEEITVKIINNTNESLFLDWTKSVIQDNKGTHRILPSKSATELVFLQMPPMLIPSNGFIENGIYLMNDTGYDYNSHVLILTLCYKLSSTSEEKYARFIIQSELGETVTASQPVLDK